MKYKFIYLLGFAALVACNNQKKEDHANDEATTVSDTTNSKGFTYAELSIKKGGSWKGHEYMDGHFENVDSLDVPKEHTDHSWYIRYEGPGWENQNIGYRIYLDWRNAIDIFGKRVDTLVLKQVGQDGFDSYHEAAPWGQDILKAGKSLGIGGYGRFVGDTVAHFRSVDHTFSKVSNNEESSSVDIEYSGWKTGDTKIDLDAKLTIFPEGRYTQVKLTPSEAVEGLTTGIVKAKADSIAVIKNDSISGDWAYIATYGKQTLVNDEDELGMAIVYNKSQVEEIKDGPYDHLVIFNATPATKTYYLLGAWDEEPDGIKTQQEFINSLDELVSKLNSGKIK